MLRSQGVDLGSIIEVGTTDAPLSYSAYESTGHLAAWMMEYFGVDRVVELYDRLDEDMGKEEVVSVLESLFGMSLSDLETEYAGAMHRVYAGRVRSLRRLCKRTSLEWDPSHGPALSLLWLWC